MEKIIYNNPETAVKNGSKWYEVTLVNNDTGEETKTWRPIFIVDKKDGGIEVSPQYLYKFFQLSETCAMLQNGAFDTEYRYIYQNGVYNHISDSKTKKILMDYIEKYQIRLLKSNILNEAMEFADCASEHYFHDVMNTDEDIINFQNGLLHLPTLDLLEHTPKVMSSIQIPCKWQNCSTQTPHFNQYLDTLTCGDKDKQRLIMEYIGAILSNVQGWRFKKMMFLLGRGDSGKSVIIRLVRELLGQTHCAERSPQGLNARFGLTAAYNNRLIYGSDLPFMKVEDNAILKSLSGGDGLSIEYKNQSLFDFVFKGFLLYGMNELSLFGGDKGEHFYNRFIILKCDNVIPIDKQDPKLIEKLLAERDGIVYKCVTAAREAIRNNYRFSTTSEQETNLDDFKRKNSLPVEFWETFMSPLGADEKPCTMSQAVYTHFEQWCSDEGLKRIPSFPEFRKDVSNFLKTPWNEMVKREICGKILISHRLND